MFEGKFVRRTWRSGDPEPEQWTRGQVGPQVWIRHPTNHWVPEEHPTDAALGIPWERLLRDLDEMVEADPMPPSRPPIVAIITQWTPVLTRRVHIVHNGLVADLEISAAGKFAEDAEHAARRALELHQMAVRAAAEQER